MKMVSSEASDCKLQTNWKRLVAVLLLYAHLSIVSGARYEHDTSTIVNKYAGARKSQQQHHHQQQRINDARVTTTDAGGGGGGAGAGGAGGGSCDDLRDLQSAVIRILNAQYEYDQAILVMHDSVEVLRKDLAQLRKKIDSIAQGDWRDDRVAAVLGPTFGRTTTADVLPSIQGSASTGAAADTAVDGGGIGVPLAFAPSPPSLSVRLDNLTFIVDRQNRRLGQLDKRLRRMKLGSMASTSTGNTEGHWPLRQTPSGPAVDRDKELEREKERLREKEKGLEREREKQTEKEKELEREREKHREAEVERQRQREAEVERERQRQRREELMVSRCEREMEMTRELTRKQREINAGVQRKIQLLEKVMEEKMQQRVQGDAPYNQLPSLLPLHNGACPNGFVRHLSSCYLFENITANWIDAEKRCQALTHDAHLVSIDNGEEEEFLIKYRSYNNARWSSRYAWIGANDMATEGRWSWVASGAEIGYSNWRRGEPSNYRGEQHCAYLQTTDGGRTDTQRNSAVSGGGGEGGKWDDWHCQSARINFVCEIVVR